MQHIVAEFPLAGRAAQFVEKIGVDFGADWENVERKGRVVEFDVKPDYPEWRFDLMEWVGWYGSDDRRLAKVNGLRVTMYGGVR